MDKSRFSALSEMDIDRYGHESFDKGHCTMELVAWIAGEPHSAAPRCTDEALAEMAMGLNDSIQDDDERRRTMLPFIIPLIGTRTGRTKEIAEALLRDAGLRGVKGMNPGALRAPSLRFDWGEYLSCCGWLGGGGRGYPNRPRRTERRVKMLKKCIWIAHGKPKGKHYGGLFAPKGEREAVTV